MNKKIATIILTTLITVVSSVNVAFADYYTDYKTLSYGMKNNEVTNLQKDLKNQGYFYYKYPTGYFGSLTKKSVMDYQKSRNLAADGVVGHATARQLKVDEVIRTAKSFYSVPYVWGGVSPSGFDCSGFTHYVLLKNDIIVPRTAADQYKQGSWVDKKNLKPGDLVFFSTYKAGASHNGIYIGNDQFIHASSAAGQVTISNLSESYYRQKYLGAKRILY